MQTVSSLHNRGMALAGLLAGATAIPADAWIVVHNIGLGVGWVEGGKTPEALEIQRFDGKADWSNGEQFQKGSPVKLRIKAGEKVRMRPSPESANYFHSFTCVIRPSDQIVFGPGLECMDGLGFQYLVIHRPGKQDAGPFIEQIKVPPISASEWISHELDAKASTLTISFPELGQGVNNESE